MLENEVEGKGIGRTCQKRTFLDRNVWGCESKRQIATCG